MKGFTDRYDILPLAFSHVQSQQEGVGYSFKSLLRPRLWEKIVRQWAKTSLLANPHFLIQTQHLEPVDGTAVDERWKLAQAIPKGVSNRTEGHNNMQVFFTAIHEEGEQSQRAKLQILISSLGNGTYCLRKEK